MQAALRPPQAIRCHRCRHDNGLQSKSIYSGLALSLDYQGRIAGDTTDHGIIAGVAFK